MKKIYLISFFSFIIISSLSAEGFNVKAKGEQIFYFKADGRNQASFTSITPLDEVDGLTTQISGKVSFDVKNITNTLKGEISLPTSSLQTGIALRDRDLKAPKWLDAERFPIISFKVKKVLNVKIISANKLKLEILGGFTLHGITNDVTVEAELTYLDESPQTEARAPGDLLGVTAKFSIILSKYGIQNTILGKRVSDNININVNIVGSNKSL
jgi:polyisoprenoid-binding protein YceI